jgi:hypothetical protein
MTARVLAVVTYSLEHNISSESGNSAAAEEISSASWNPIRYRVHKSPPLDHIPTQYNPVHTHIYYFYTRFNIVLT